jgi:hypothetical protein
MICFSRVESVAHGRLGLSKRLEEALKTIDRVTTPPTSLVVGRSRPFERYHELSTDGGLEIFQSLAPGSFTNRACLEWS